jgi:hypothetical protein
MHGQPLSFRVGNDIYTARDVPPDSQATALTVNGGLDEGGHRVAPQPRYTRASLMRLAVARVKSSKRREEEQAEAEAAAKALMSRSQSTPQYASQSESGELSSGPSSQPSGRRTVPSTTHRSNSGMQHGGARLSANSARSKSDTSEFVANSQSQQQQYRGDLRRSNSVPRQPFPTSNGFARTATAAAASRKSVPRGSPLGSHRSKSADQHSVERLSMATAARASSPPGYPSPLMPARTAPQQPDDPLSSSPPPPRPSGSSASSEQRPQQPSHHASPAAANNSLPTPTYSVASSVPYGSMHSPQAQSQRHVAFGTHVNLAQQPIHAPVPPPLVGVSLTSDGAVTPTGLQRRQLVNATNSSNSNAPSAASTARGPPPEILTSAASPYPLDPPSLTRTVRALNHAERNAFDDDLVRSVERRPQPSSNERLVNAAGAPLEMEEGDGNTGDFRAEFRGVWTAQFVGGILMGVILGVRLAEHCLLGRGKRHD